MSVNGNPSPPSTRHPLLEALHRELGLARVEPQEVIVAGRRWLLRPLTFDDQVWATSKLQGNPGDNYLIYAAQAAIALAAIGELATEEVTGKRPMMNPDGSAQLGDDGKPVEEDVLETRPLPKEKQPAFVPTITLFPPVFGSAMSLAVAAGLQAAPVFNGDPMDPPNPWRELVADQVFAYLRGPGCHFGVSRDLFYEVTRIMEGVEVPQLPLPRPSQKGTTT